MPATVTPATDATVEASVFWMRHRRNVIAGVAIVLLAAIGGGGYWFYRERRNAAAAEMLGSAKTAADYQKVIAQYPGTAAYATALLLLAEQQRSDGKFAEANTILQRFVAENAKHELVSTAWMAIGANLESLGKMDDALATYQRLATSDPHSFNAPLALLAQVRLLKEKKQADEARKVCETILTQYRDSFAAGEASRQLRLLKPPAPATPAQQQTGAQPPASIAAPPAAPPRVINITPPPAAPKPQPTGPTGPPPKKP